MNKRYKLYSITRQRYLYADIAFPSGSLYKTPYFHLEEAQKITRESPGEFLVEECRLIPHHVLPTQFKET